MKKLIKIISLFFIIFIILHYSYDITNNIRMSFSLCINNLFPTLIPFMILSNLLIEYNYIKDLNELFKSFMHVFKVNNNCLFILIMSILSGTPSNAKYIKDLLNKNLITIDDAYKCLNFCHFTNPIFILQTIGLTFLNNKKLGLLILISHYTSALMIGLFNKKNNKIINVEINNKYTNSFISTLKESIKNTIDNLLLILGVVTVFIIITTLIAKIIYIPDNYKFIFGFIEITQGLKYLSLSNFNIITKGIISCFLISFGGFSIHMQVFSILDNKKIRYLPYFSSRLIQAILSSFILFVLISMGIRF